MDCPNFLQEYSEIYKKEPREACRQWFANAKYGLFLHYGLYSLLGRHEWVQYTEKIRVKKYAELMNRFTADQFDAEKFAQFAVDCGMRYINITTRHHDSFCLWDTKYTDFNSLNAPAHRDLVKELADACEKYALGLVLYYSHGRDWRHPHAPNNDEWGGDARPRYRFPKESSYKYGNEHDLNIYLEFMMNQVSELLTKYPTVAGIWLDGISTPLSRDYSKFKVPELYDLIRQTSPHALISYKQGLTGTEEYFAPEHKLPKDGKSMKETNKTIEICTTMAIKPRSWGYYKNAKHMTTEEVIEKLKWTRQLKVNLLLNSGPLPDGSIDPIDKKRLLEVGQFIQMNKILE